MTQTCTGVSAGYGKKTYVTYLLFTSNDTNGVRDHQRCHLLFNPLDVGKWNDKLYD